MHGATQSNQGRFFLIFIPFRKTSVFGMFHSHVSLLLDGLPDPVGVEEDVGVHSGEACDGESVETKKTRAWYQAKTNIH